MATAFPQGGRSIVERMCAKFPELFVNDDELQRQLTIKIGQQFAFSYGPTWGGKKRAGVPDALRSKDSVAVKEADGTTSVFDMFSSSLAILVNDGDLPVVPSHSHLPPSEATFMADAPFNYLGDEPPDPEPPSDDLEARVVALEDQVAILHAENLDQTAQITELAAKLAHLEQHALKDTDTLKVIGRTGDKYAHSHPVNLEVTR